MTATRPASAPPVPDVAELASILGRQPDGDRIKLVEALRPALGRGVKLIERDHQIRELAALLPIAGLSERKRAQAVLAELRRYASGHWLRDRAISVAPPSFIGGSRGLLFSIFRHAEPPLGLSQVRAILAESGRSDPG